MTTIASIEQEVDVARRQGSLKQIIIPPCPELLLRLREVMGQTEPDLNEVARIASSDVAMSAALIRLANSPRFAGDHPCITVGQAMTRVGLDETATAMTNFMVRNAIKVSSPHLERFWERSTKRALAMAHIARQLPGMSADLAYTFGLFCHVGMPVLLQCVRGYGSTLVEARARVDRSFIATENANHKTDHAVTGALVIRAWGMGAPLMATVRLHHDFGALSDERIEPEVRSLVAAGLVAEHLMRRHERLDDDKDWADHHGAAMAWLHISQEDLKVWEESIEQQFEEHEQS